MTRRTLLPVLAILATLAAPATAQTLRVNNEEVTLDKLLDQFREIVFKTEDGQARRLHKWTGAITVRLAGEADPYRADIERMMKLLAGASKLPIRMAGDRDTATLMVRFVPVADIKKRWGAGANCISTYQVARSFITMGEIFLPTDTDRTRHCIAEELIQILGLPNDTPIIKNSIFNEDAPPTLRQPSAFDLMHVTALYDHGIRPGSTEAEALPRVRELLSEQMNDLIRRIKERQSATAAKAQPAAPGATGVAAAVTPPPAPAVKRVSTGTGIVVSGDGAIATNAHVVDNCSSIKIFAEGRPLDADLVNSDKTNDLALLRTREKFQNVAAFASEGSPLGAKVVTYGFPLSNVLASQGNFTLGNITALAGPSNDSRFVQISAPIQPGNSGGPVIDSKGQLVGVVTKRLVSKPGLDAQNVNFALRAQALRYFLEANSVNITVGRAAKEYSDVDLAALSKSIAVKVQCTK